MGSEDKSKTFENSLDRYNSASNVFSDYLSHTRITGDIVESYDNWLEFRLRSQIMSQAVPTTQGRTIRFDGVKLVKRSVNRDRIVNGKTVRETVNLTPALARNLSMMYGIDIYCNMKLYDSDGNVAVEHPSPVFLGTYPLMVGSKFGHLHGCSAKERLKQGECHRDPPGYLILNNAMEKAVLMKENLRESRILIFEVKVGIVCRMTCVTGNMKTKTVQLSLDENVYKGAIMVRLIYTQSKAVITCYQALRGLHLIMNENNSDYDDDLMSTKFNMYTEDILRFVPHEELESVKFQLIPSITATEATVNDAKFASIKAGHTARDFDDRSDELSKHYYNQLAAEMFPQIRSLNSSGDIDPASIRNKYDMLCCMIARYSRFLAGHISVDDRDNWGNKMLKLPGYTMERWWAKSWQNHAIAPISNAISSGGSSVNVMNAAIRAINHKTIMSNFLSNFSSNSWNGSKGYNADSTAVDLDRNSLLASYSIITKTNTPTTRDAGQLGIRKVEASQCGYMCPAETPEGKPCGLVKNRAVGCWISIYRDEKPIIEQLRPYLRSVKTKESDRYCIINGFPIGWGEEDITMKLLRNIKRNFANYFDISIIVDGLTIVISTDAGRPTRPLFVVKNWTEDGEGRSELEMDVPDENGQLGWGKEFPYLLRTGRVEYVEAIEQENVAVAPSITMFDDSKREISRARENLEKQRQFKKENNTYVREKSEIKIGNRIYVGERETHSVKHYSETKLSDAQHIYEKLLSRKPYDYCEIDPNSISSISTGMIPFANHNPGPRITYQDSMGKQALGHATSVDHLRFDALSKTLVYPSEPIVKTDMHDRIGMGDLPTGQTVILAFMSYSGFNQEDAIIMNKGSIDRGLFRYVVEKSKKVVIKHGGGDGSTEKFTKPDPREGYPTGAYSHIKSNGMPMVGSKIGTYYCIVGKTHTIHIDGVKDKVYDTSLYAGKGDDGRISQVIEPTDIPDTSNTVAKIKIINVRSPVEGDKYASRHAQKSVIGKIMDEQDMPFTENGMKPDIIINPHAIPTRMTAGMLIEIIASNVAVFTGEAQDATSFKPFDIDMLTRSLRAVGFKGFMEGEAGRTIVPPRDSIHTMYNGMTGEIMEARVMIGPCYYQALPHNVIDKIQIRATGQTDRRTKQPVAGATRGGGLRLSEYGVAAIAAHGAAAVLKERTSTSADACEEIYCTVCNNRASEDTQTIPLSSGEVEYRTVYKCDYCGSGSFGRCDISNSLNLLRQTLIPAGIKIDVEVTDEIEEDMYEF